MGIADCGLRIADCGLRIEEILQLRSPHFYDFRLPIKAKKSAIRNPQSAIPDRLLDQHPNRSICYGTESGIFLG